MLVWREYTRFSGVKQLAYVGKRPNTLVRLTKDGRAATECHWQKLESLRNEAEQWQPEE